MKAKKPKEHNLDWAFQRKTQVFASRWLRVYFAFTTWLNYYDCCVQVWNAAAMNGYFAAAPAAAAVAAVNTAAAEDTAASKTLVVGLHHYFART